MLIKSIRILVAFLVTTCPLPARPSTETSIARVENGLLPPVVIVGGPEWTIGERMERYGVPGVSIAVIEDFSVVWAKGYGVMDAGNGEPVTEATLFQAASISKTLNATAILREVQTGRLALDVDVNSYLRSWKLPENELTAAKKVTIANLLSHTGGTTVSGFPGYAVGIPLPTVRQILDGEAPANTLPVVVDIEPGTRYRYSGGGVTILQLLLTEVEGKPYPQIMQETILDPLGMTSSTFSQPLPPELRPLAATAHLRGTEPLEGGHHVYPELAAAGLWTTPTDLARFTIEHQLSLRGESNRILSREMEVKMITAYISDFYGLGFWVRDMDGEVYFQHSGGNRGFNCLLIAHADAGCGAVIMANAMALELIDEITRAIAREYSWPGFIDGPHELHTVSLQTLNRCAGRYRIDTDELAIVSVVDDHLKVERTSRSSYELLPVSETDFVRQDRKGRTRFVLGATPAEDVQVISGRDSERILPRMAESPKMPIELLLAGDADAAREAYRALRADDATCSAVGESRLNRLGYNLLGNDLVEAAIAIFELNVEFYPSSSNVYDSLGEAHLAAGHESLAIENYKKSLELDPENANAARVLEEIGAAAKR
jgi:CubicO group peptidase (beta-lactamase class C family)